MASSPGKSYRQGISLIELTDMFPDEESAVKWFEAVRWPDGVRCCGHCGSTATRKVPNAKPMPYWCTDCRSYFSVRTGTNIEKSRLPLRKWVFAIYLFVTHLKGVSSMKLHRDLKITQKTAWFMLHRLRDSWGNSGLEKFAGPVEIDETYVGGKRKELKQAGMGRGPAGKSAIVGAKDRKTKKVTARVVQSTDALTLQGFVEGVTEPDAKVYTDEAPAYKGMARDHESVNHSVGEYVRDMAHTNGMESFWSMMKRGYVGTYHKMSAKRIFIWGRSGILRKTWARRPVPADPACHLHGNIPGGVDLQQPEGPALQFRGRRQQREGVVRTALQRHLVQRQRGQVGEQRREAVYRKPVGRALVRRLGLRALRDLGLLHRGAPLSPGALAIVVLEQDRREAPAQVPFHVARKHAKEHMRPDVILGMHVHGPDPQPRGLHRQERALHLREALAILHGRFRPE